MSRVVLGRLLFAGLLVTCVAVGRSAAAANYTWADSGEGTPLADNSAPETQATKKEGEKKPGDADKKPAGKKPDEKKADGKKPDEKKPDEKKPDKSEKKETPEKPATHKVKKGTFRIEVSLDGVFEAENQAELFIRPQEWAGLTVLKAVEHGTPVKQGDLVLALETDKIDRLIADFRADLELNELSLRQGAAQLAAMEKIAPLEEQANDRSRRITEEDWKQFREVDKPLRVKMNDFQLKMAQDYLEYAEEEYRQLEKMYKADDLAEDTEKIVLRRAKAGVDRAKLNMEFATAYHEEGKKFTVPRLEERTKDQTERSLIDAEFTKVTLPMLVSKRRLEQEKLQVACDQAREKLKRLTADREAMIVKAPIDGIVYYGHATRGKWSPVNSEMMRRGAPIMPNDVFMTVVQTRPLYIRATVPESQFQRVRPGMQALVQADAFPGLKLTAVVNRVAAVPLGSMGFDCQLTVANDGLNSAVVPGINCEMKMIAYKKTDALTVPPKSVFTEELDLAKQYVYLLGKDGKPKKRDVTLGNRNDKQVEVLAGLAAGDEVLLEKPKDE